MPTGESASWFGNQSTGADPKGLSYRPEPGANRSHGWRGTSPGSRTTTSPTPPESSKRGSADGWHQRFGMEPDPHNTGYGHGPDEVAAIPADRSYYSPITRRSPTDRSRTSPQWMTPNWAESSIAPTTRR